MSRDSGVRGPQLDKPCRNVTDQVLHPSKITSEIIALYILMFTCFTADSKKGVINRMVASIPQI
jgi:hypothetical protein